MISTILVALPVGLFAPRCTFAEGPPSDLPTPVFQLKLGDRLTVLSDGLVEAQSTTGELFGFDRTAVISTQSAEAIAQAAQAFGQEHDIIVLTVRFAGLEGTLA